MTATAADAVAALHRFGVERDRLRTALARRLGLPPSDLDTLEHLELGGPLSQRDLAERLLLTSGAVTLLVDRLAQAGLVVRRPHPTDRRISLVALAPDPSLPDVPELDRYHAAVRAAAAALSGPARDDLCGFLDAVTASATETTGTLRGAPR